MKHSKPMLKFFIVILLLSLIIISCEKKPAEVKIEYDKAVGPITLKGKALQFYRINYNMNLSKENVFEMAKKLINVSLKSLNFEKLEEMEDGLMVLRNEKDRSTSFEMDTRSGNFLYNGGLLDYKNDNNTPDLITGEKAKVLALDHLEKLHLFPNREELVFENIGGLNMAMLKEDSTSEVYKKLVSVRFNRKLSDVPVMGNSRIIVNMGSNGKLAGLIYYWGKVIEKRDIGAYALITDEDIKKELEMGIRAASTDAKRILVQKVDYVMYDDGKGYIEPAFYVVARLFYDISKGKEGVEPVKYDIPYDLYIPVLKKPLAFYPHMETAKVQPTDESKLEITPKDDE